MKKNIITLLLVASAALNLLFPVDSFAEFSKIKIAVLDFEQKGKFETDDIGKMVAEWLTTNLVETGRFDIVERRLLNKVLAEQSIGASAIVDPNSASQLGRVLGVKTVITGSVSNYGGVIDINARLISVETASIRAAESVSTESPKELRKLVAQISDKIMLTFPLEGYVLERIENRAVIDLGRRQGIRAGMKFVAYVEGKTRKHPKTGEILDVETIERGSLVIKEVKEKTATAVILNEAYKNAIDTKCMVRGLLKDDEERIRTMSRLDEENVRAQALEEKKVMVRLKDETQRPVALPESSAPAIDSAETDDFLFKLKSVKKSGEDITIFIVAVNRTDRTRYLAVYDQSSRYTKSKLVDDAGESYDVKEVNLWQGSNKTTSYYASRGISVDGGQSLTIEMIFKEIPVTAGEVKQLKFHPYIATKMLVYRWRDVDLLFKDIRVSR